MPTELEGAVQLRIALKRFDGDLSKATQSELSMALRSVTAVAKGFIPSEGQMLSGWTNNVQSSETISYRPFPKFNSTAAKAGITYSTTPSKPNKNGFVALARILNKSAGGAIYETAGRKNADGQPNPATRSLTYRTNSDIPGAAFEIHHAVFTSDFGSKDSNNSLNPNAGKQFIDRLNSTGKLVNARPVGMKGRPSRKQTGRVIFRAWAEDNGRANAAVFRALEKASALFYEHTKRAA